MSAGRSSPCVRAEASRSSAVRGASLCSADRSSARALACSSPSGQAAKGRSVARASSVCTGRDGVACARSVACSCGAASGPCRRSVAAHSPVPAGCWDRSSAATTARSSVVATWARPPRRNLSQSSCRPSSLCRAPPSAPSSTWAANWRSGVSTPSMWNASTRSEFTVTPTGSCRLFGGSVSALGSSDRARSTRAARSMSNSMRSHRLPPAGRRRGALQRRSCRRRPMPSPGSDRSTCCALKSPSRLPRMPLTCSPGTCGSSHFAPVSVYSNHAHAPTTSAAAPARPSR